MRNVLVIGAGASGMIAAISAASYGARVTVYEHNDIPGKKLNLTGNGKCNYTNTDISKEHYNCSDPAFLDSVLKQFSYTDCIEFFRSIGIEPEIKKYRFDDSGYVYPRGKKAGDLKDALFRRALRLGVSFRFRTPAEEQDIEKSKDGKFIPKFFRNDNFDALIIATGSNSYPASGSDNSIYPLLKKFELGFKGFLPALCPLYTRDESLKFLKGQRNDSKVQLYVDGKLIKSSFGQVQYTEHYLSGIPVMNVSHLAAIALKEGKSCALSVDGKKYEIYRTGGFDKAQCSSGGIDLEYIDPDTMESKREKGIYICGELLDIDGECGGYNLHLAWATGYIAGKNAALGK